MKPSDRIKLIKQVVTGLDALEWNEVDLTLRQFGLPWSETWNGSKTDYCLKQIEQGEDTALLALYEHLHEGRQFDQAPRVEAEHIWRDGYFRLFISHISSHAGLASEIKNALTANAIDAFVAHEDIEPTKEWQQEIEAALDTCDGLAVLLTPDFHDSLWTDQEVGYCVRRRLLVLPIRLGMDPYGFLGRYQALSPGKRDATWIANAIFDILLEHELTADRMAPAVTKMFEDSGSFAEAKANLLIIKRVPRWTPDLLRRLEAAIESNWQIKQAWYVPDEIRQIVREHSRKR